MNRNGFETYEEIEEAISLSENKSNIEEKLMTITNSIKPMRLRLANWKNLLTVENLLI